MTTVGASCQIHLQLKGLVDVAREVGGACGVTCMCEMLYNHVYNYVGEQA